MIGLSLALLALLGVPSGPSVAADGVEPRYEDCAEVDASGLRDAINELAQSLLDEELARFDLEHSVARAWQAHDMDRVIAREVARSVTQVKDDTGYWTRLLSGWSPDRGKELADRVARNAFGSEAFRQGIERVSGDLAQELTRYFEGTMDRAASASILCVQTFVGSAYGGLVKGAFEGELLEQAAQIELANELGDQGTATRPPIASAAGAATIVGAMVARRVAMRLTQVLTQRIVGQVIARVTGRAVAAAVPIVGWVVGVGLIAWDLIDGRNGALPAIEKALTAPETSTLIRDEIVNTVRRELPLITAQVGRDVADEVFARWQDFRDKYAAVLSLAEREDRFRQFLNTVTARDLYQLAQINAALGAPATLAALDNGQLARAVELPPASIELLRTEGSLGPVLAWERFAGPHLTAVVDLGIYRHVTPEDLTTAQLDRLVHVNDAAAIAKLLVLDKAALQRLLDLSLGNLKRVAERSSANELDVLAWYAERLETSDLSQLIALWLANDTDRSRLRGVLARRGIVNADSAAQAMGFVTRDPGWLDPYRDLMAIARGEHSPSLVAARYGGDRLWGIALALGLPLIALFLLFRRRPVRVVVKERGSGRPPGN